MYNVFTDALHVNYRDKRILYTLSSILYERLIELKQQIDMEHLWNFVLGHTKMMKGISVSTRDTNGSFDVNHIIRKEDQLLTTISDY